MSIVTQNAEYNYVYYILTALSSNLVQRNISINFHALPTEGKSFMGLGICRLKCTTLLASHLNGHHFLCHFAVEISIFARNAQKLYF